MLHILIFLKAPRRGFVKTRLAQQIGDEEALKAYKALVNKQLTSLPADTKDEIHYTPADAEAELSSWLGSKAHYYPQADGDLGTRLSSAMNHAFQRGADTVVCIGGDCPGLSQSHFEQTAELLKQGKQVVLGPSEDGGYYLIGMNEPQPEIFENIPWSSRETFNATLQKAHELGLKTSLLETLYDVDQAEELDRAVADGLITL